MKNKRFIILPGLILSLFSSVVLAQNNTNPTILIDNHGHPIIIYNNPCARPPTVPPGVKIYPSPLIDCDKNNQNNNPQPQIINPMIYPPYYPYISVPENTEEAMGGIGFGLGYGLGRALK